jgi:hypothetical protein
MLLLVACSPAAPRGIPAEAVDAALAACDEPGCANTRLGPTSTTLPYEYPWFGRWCLEVLYEADHGSGSYIVEVFQIMPEPDMIDSWMAQDPQYGLDCGYFEAET